MEFWQTNLQRTKWWFLYDTVFAWGLIIVAVLLLLFRPLGTPWQNVVLGVLVACQLVVWSWAAKNRRDPAMVHPVFFQITMVLMISMIVVSSNMWRHLRW